MLAAAPGLQPIAIFEEMIRRHPELGAGIRRTLERRIRGWRALHGAEREAIFRSESDIESVLRPEGNPIRRQDLISHENRDLK